MDMATAAHRRKGAIYGKPHRKPLIDATFASDGSPLWNEEWRSHLSCKDVPGSSRKLQSSFESSGSLSKEAKIKTVLKPDSGALYDFPSSEEERSRPKIAQRQLEIRKRRKLIQIIPSEERSPVFDDESLQRHIAEEVSGTGQGQLADIGNVDVSRASHEEVIPGARNGKLRLKHKSERRPMPGGRRQTYLQRGGKPGKVSMPTSATASTTDSLKAVPRPKFPDMTPSEDQEVPRPDPSTEDQSISSLPQPPSTPTRRISVAPTKGTTTPRQRDLWNRLLADSNRSVSPSYLDLSSLRIAGRSTKTIRNRSDFKRTSTTKGPELGLQPRPIRLIDTLNTPRVHAISRGFESSDEATDSSSDSDLLSRSGGSVTSTANDFLTLETSPSTTSQTKSTQAIQALADSVVQGSSVLQTGGSRITYAQQRSYLVDHAMDQRAVFDTQLVPSTTPPQQSRSGMIGATEHASRQKTSYIYDLEDVPELQSGAMRSIHELRQAGGNARSLGELETLLDQLVESQGNHSAKHSALMGLASKFQEPSHCRTFVDTGLESRLLLHIKLGDDLITKSLMVFTMLGLIVHCHSAVLLSQLCDAPALDFLVGLLQADEDLIRSCKQRSFNMSKVAQRDYTMFCGEILNSAAWRVGRPQLLSCQVVSLQCLEYLVRRQREGGMTGEIFAADQFQRLIETSIPEAASVSHSDAMSSVCVHLAVSILESCTIRNAHRSERFWPRSVMTRITGILPAVHSSSTRGPEVLQVLALRLYLNVTNTVPRLCEDFAQPAIVNTIFSIMLSYFNCTRECDAKDQSLLLDQAILSLGCLINFAEVSDTMRNLSLKQRQGQPQILDVLLELFIMNSRKAAEVKISPWASNIH